MPLLKGHLIAESPIYRGNGLKTLFSRKNKRDCTPIELPGRPDGRDPGKALMDAFLGFTNKTRDRTTYIDKLFDGLYKRLFDDRNNEAFFKNIKIDCSFNDPRKKEDCFYDLRMGIRLNRDRMSMEENANYKIETVFKGTNFNFSLDYPNTFDNTQKGKLYLLLKELIDGRFWFGAGKTKGLGKIRLCLDENSSREFEKLNTVEPPIKNTANAMEIRVSFRLSNPLLVG
jgi:CRISPR/Cas system CSM-associated protein Csm3 (group 7 of RAMP superfamily)